MVQKFQIKFAIIFLLLFLYQNANAAKDQQQRSANRGNFTIIPLPTSPGGPFPSAQQPGNTPSTQGPNLGQLPPIIANQVPALPFCRVGQRFIVNHILFVCHQFGEQRRGFKPFACALRNHAESRLLTRNSTLDEHFFRYKCQDSGDGTLRLQALNCILSEIEIKAGQSLRRGRSEYLCIRDDEGLFKLIEKQFLHDFCLPGNRNESLLEDDKCPGVTIGTIHAAFGSGSEVIFETKIQTIVPREKKSTPMDDGKMDEKNSSDKKSNTKNADKKKAKQAKQKRS